MQGKGNAPLVTNSIRPMIHRYFFKYFSELAGFAPLPHSRGPYIVFILIGFIILLSRS